jgi:DNA-binding NtrC family response regulator
VLTLPNVPTDHAPSRAAVLVIDPEPLYRWFVTQALAGCAADVMTSASIEDAAAHLRDFGRVDLLIADGDLVLGGGRSLQLLRERTGATPFLVLDSDGDLSRHRLSYAMVVAKPVDSMALISLVTRALCQDGSAS